MTFDDAFEKVIGHEGGYVDDPLDPGGRTKYGISQRAYPGEDIQAMTLERAKAIYKRDYWGPAGCDLVPEALRFDLFDMAVNQGVKTAIKALQHAVHETQDGIIGPKTLQAIQSSYIHQLLYRFTAARLVAYTRADDARWARFGRGWIRRVASNMEGKA
jgi:lysozyme family protein